MTEEIKNAIELHLSGDSCIGCPYIDDPECERTILDKALEALNQQDEAIGYLSELNAKLAQELKNSLELKEGDNHG